LARQQSHRIRAELLPAYAPELNPVELIWGHAKTHSLANFAPLELADLAMQAHPRSSPSATTSRRYARSSDTVSAFS
jgi:transposase